MSSENQLVRVSKKVQIPDSAKIIHILGTKNGVGKTFFTVNFASLLKKKGYKVLIIDGNYFHPSAHIMLNVDETESFQEYLDKEISSRMIITKGVGGVDLFFAYDKTYPVYTMPEGLNFVQEVIEKSIDRYDFILVDSESMGSANVRALLPVCHRTILISDPSLTALDGFKRILPLLAQSGLMETDLVFNRVMNPQWALRLHKNIQELCREESISVSLPMLGFLLEDPERVFMSIQKRTPLTLMSGTGGLNGCFDLMINSFLNRETGIGKKSFFNKILGKRK